MNSSGKSITIQIDQHRFQWNPEEWKTLDCIETAPDEFHLLEHGQSHRITVLEYDLKARTCLLKIDGEIKSVRFLRDLDLMIERMGLNATQSKAMKELHAPMPGLVTGLKTENGAAVEKGTPLLILEAMKMENVITAPQAGTIKSLHVTKGQAVDKGDLLVEFE